MLLIRNMLVILASVWRELFIPFVVYKPYLTTVAIFDLTGILPELRPGF